MKRTLCLVILAIVVFIVFLFWGNSTILHWSGHNIYYGAIRFVDDDSGSFLEGVELQADNRKIYGEISHSNHEGFVYLLYRTNSGGSESILPPKEYEWESQHPSVSYSKEGYNSGRVLLNGKRIHIDTGTEIWYVLRSNDMIVIDATAAQFVGWANPDSSYPDSFPGQLIQMQKESSLDPRDKGE